MVGLSPEILTAMVILGCVVVRQGGEASDLDGPLVVARVGGNERQGDRDHLHAIAVAVGRLADLGARALETDGVGGAGAVLERDGHEIGRASCRKECRSRWSPYQ